MNKIEFVNLMEEKDDFKHMGKKKMYWDYPAEIEETNDDDDGEYNPDFKEPSEPWVDYNDRD